MRFNRCATWVLRGPTRFISQHYHTSIATTMDLRVVLLVSTLLVGIGRSGANNLPLPAGRNGLCVIGCTPYVDPTRTNSGLEKYAKLVEEMAQTCDAMVHVGDTKAGKAPCNSTLMTHAMHTLIDAGKRHQTLVLYAPGDNELNDCHRHQSAPPSRRQPSEFVRAVDARQFMVQDLQVNSGQDLTGLYPVEQHVKTQDNLATCLPGSGEPCRPYNCDFDKYIELDDFAVATLEVIGSHWYLDVSVEECKNEVFLHAID